METNKNERYINLEWSTLKGHHSINQVRDVDMIYLRSFDGIIPIRPPYPEDKRTGWQAVALWHRSQMQQTLNSNLTTVILSPGTLMYSK